MGITKNASRQEPLVAFVDINFSDLISGADAPAIQLPANALVLSGALTVLTPFNSATSDVLDVGDAGSQNRYLNDANIHVAGHVALVPTGYQMAAQGDVTVRWVGVGAAPTAGKVRLTLQYIVIGREQSTQG